MKDMIRVSANDSRTTIRLSEGLRNVVNSAENEHERAKLRESMGGAALYAARPAVHLRG